MLNAVTTCTNCVNTTGIGAALGVFFAIYAVIAVVGIIATVKIITKAGYSGWWVLIWFVPLLNLVFFLIFAFSDWPVLQRLRAPRNSGPCTAAATALPVVAMAMCRHLVGRRPVGRRLVNRRAYPRQGRLRCRLSTLRPNRRNPIPSRHRLRHRLRRPRLPRRRRRRSRQRVGTRPRTESASDGGTAPRGPARPADEGPVPALQSSSAPPVPTGSAGRKCRGRSASCTRVDATQRVRTSITGSMVLGSSRCDSSKRSDPS